MQPHKNTLVFVLCLLFNFELLADTLKFKAFGNEYDNFAKDVILCQDNGYLIVGSTYVSEEKKSDVYLLKLTPNFEKEWSFAYGGNNVDGANAVIQLSNGNFILAGYSNSFGNHEYDMYLLAVDESGGFLWEKTMGGLDWDFAHDLILTYDDKLLLCGETYSYGNGNSDAYLIKMDTNGDTLFTRTYGVSGKDVAYALIETSDSLVYICGKTYTATTDSTNILLWKLDQNHNTVFTINMGGTRTDIAYDIIESQDKNIVIAGATGSLSNRSDVNQYLVKLNPLGQIIWELEGGNAASGNLDDAYHSVAQNSLDLYLAGGYTKTYGYLNSQDISVSCFDQNSNFRQGGNIGLAEDEWIEKIITVNDQFVLVGNVKSYTNGNTDVFVGYGFNDMLSVSTFFHVGNVKDTFIVSLPEIDLTNEVQLFPNPAQSYVWIETNTTTPSQLIVHSITGEVIQNHCFTKKHVLNVTDFASGLYWISILDQDKIVQKKFIKP